MFEDKLDQLEHMHNLLEEGWLKTEADANVIREKICAISCKQDPEISFFDIPYKRQELFKTLFADKHTTLEFKEIIGQIKSNKRIDCSDDIQPVM